MQTVNLLLLGGYVLIAVLLLSLNVRANWHWSIKFGAIALTTLTYFSTWWALRESEGWPAIVEPPGGFELIAFDIREPDKRSGDDGAIYLWLRHPGAVDGVPRAHRLEYREELHEAVVQAGRRMAEGQQQVTERGSGSEAAQGAGGALRFRDMNRTSLPPKASQ